MSDHRAAILVFIAALAVRGVMVIASERTTPIIDMIEYQGLADRLMSGKGYRSEDGPTAFRPPLYPAFIAAAGMVLGNSPAAVRAGHAVLGAATCVLTMTLGTFVAGPKMGRRSGWIMALYPPHIVYTSYLHREILYTFLVMAGIVVMVRGRSWGTFLGGVLLGLAALTNSLALAMIPVAAVCLGLRRFWRRALLVLIGGVVTVLPWTIRNYAVLNGFVPVNTKTGVVFWEGNDEGWLRGETEWDIRTRHWRELEPLDELSAHRYGMARAGEFIQSNPAGFLYLSWRRFLQFWRVDLLFYFYLKMGYWGHVPTAAVIVLSPLLLLAFPALVVGGVLGSTALGRPRGAWATALAIGGVQVLFGSLFVGGFRYHFPVVPLLAVASAAAACGLRSLKVRRPRGLVASALIVLACFNWLDQACANRHQIRQLLGVSGGRFDDHLTRSWMKRGIF